MRRDIRGKRYYGGCQCVDVVESIAIERAKNCLAVIMQTYSRIPAQQANMAVFIAMLKPGDTVMGMNSITADIDTRKSCQFLRFIFQHCAVWCR